MCAGGFGGGGARGGRLAVAASPTAVGPAQSGVSNTKRHFGAMEDEGGDALAQQGAMDGLIPTDPAQRVYFGASICEVAVLLIAIGANVQRFGLDRISHERMLLPCLALRDAVWFCGLSIYFSANVLYTIALVFAPASLCATLMATIVPINAVSSRLILGEVLQVVDVQGGLLISAGISCAAYAAPYTTDTYDAAAMQSLADEPDAVACFGVMVGIVVSLATVVLAHEHGCSCSFAGAMPFAYPVVVGLLESLVQVAQKGGSSMLALALSGEVSTASQLEAPVFWLTIGVWVGTSVLVVWWLRKGLRNLEASRLLPIEYGTFTAASVVAGLVVYNEAQYVSTQHRWLMAAGVVLVACGCALVGSRRAIRCEARWTTDEMEALHDAALQEALLLSAPAYLTLADDHAERKLLKPEDLRSDGDGDALRGRGKILPLARQLTA